MPARLQAALVALKEAMNAAEPAARAAFDGERRAKAAALKRLAVPLNAADVLRQLQVLRAGWGAGTGGEEGGHPGCMGTGAAGFVCRSLVCLGGWMVVWGGRLCVCVGGG